MATSGITPYAAFQAQSFHTPTYGETDATGLAAFALTYGAHTFDEERSELGVRFDSRLALADSSILLLRGRLAWAHEFSGDPSIAATFQTLPGAAFTVFGAACRATRCSSPPARSCACPTAGACAPSSTAVLRPIPDLRRNRSATLYVVASRKWGRHTDAILSCPRIPGPSRVQEEVVGLRRSVAPCGGLVHGRESCDPSPGPNSLQTPRHDHPFRRAQRSGWIIIGCCMRHRHQEFIRFLNQVEAEVPAWKIIHTIVAHQGQRLGDRTSTAPRICATSPCAGASPQRVSAKVALRTGRVRIRPDVVKILR